MTSATDLALFVLALLVLSVWIPVTAWVTVQCIVYGFFMAKRRFARHYQEK